MYFFFAILCRKVLQNTPIFRTNKVQLIAEPENKHDENAIKVLIYSVHLGYVPRNQTEEIHKELENENKYKAIIKADLKHRFDIEITTL